MIAACVCLCVVCTSVSMWAQGTFHAPGLSVKTAAFCVCGLPVETQRLSACQGFCNRLPADPLVVYLLSFVLLCQHSLCYYIHIQMGIINCFHKNKFMQLNTLISSSIKKKITDNYFLAESCA